MQFARAIKLRFYGGGMKIGKRPETASDDLCYLL